MTDREKYLTILDRFYRGRGGSLLTKDEREAMEYAISSIKTDLKYDLLYEETNHIADTDKKIEPITKNDLAVDVPDNNVGKIDRPSVTPQEPYVNNICDSCHTKGCIFQSGIKRVNCEFYTAQNEPCNDAISRESLLNKDGKRG